MAENLMMTSRLVPLHGGINFRDLGGYGTEDGREVRWRTLFRCGHLSNLTAQDLQALASWRVTHIHDFRRPDEQQRNPSQPLNARFYADYAISIGSLSRFWEYLGSEQLSAETAHQLVVGAYRACIDDVAPHYSRMFQALLANEGNATIFHCAAGKDRTGMAAALILSALGVPREVVVEDYLLTQEYFDTGSLLETVEQHLRNAKVERWERSWLLPYCGVHRDNIEAFFEGVEAGYGSVAGYMQRALGLSGKDLAELQRIYLLK
jgi:protein-tyrosine phosphatase